MQFYFLELNSPSFHQEQHLAGRPRRPDVLYVQFNLTPINVGVMTKGQRDVTLLPLRITSVSSYL